MFVKNVLTDISHRSVSSQQTTFSYSVIRFLTSTFFVFPAAIYANRK